MASVFYLFGLLLCILGAVMAIPGIVEISLGDPHADAFFTASATTVFVGISLVATCWRRRPSLSVREMYAFTALSWSGSAFFAALPFLFHGMNLSISDAYFEAFSGMTTTGSTVLVGLDSMSRGILVWRSLLQWLGGIGIIVMAIIALPILRVGGMQLYRTESSDNMDRILPTVAQTVRAIGSIYLAMTILCAGVYWSLGMSAFDAVNHALTTLSTGGYSTHDASFGYFKEPALHWAAVIFMIAGSVPFGLYLLALHRDPWAVLRSSQVRLFLAIIAAASLALVVWMQLTGPKSLLDALKDAFFNVASLITTTGYVSGDYQTWGGLAVLIFLLISFVGGCAGSTSGGIKIFRFQITFLFAKAQVQRQLYPHRVVASRLDGSLVDPDVAGSVLAFVGLYIASVIAVALTLSAFGLDMLTALSGSIQAIGNVGPGLGPVIGPAGNFEPLPNAAKWVLCVAMLLGRLELMTVLVLLTPGFWRE